MSKTEPRWRFVRWKGNIYIQIAPSHKLRGYPSELRQLEPNTTSAIEALYEIHEIPDKPDPREPTEQVPVYDWKP